MISLNKIGWHGIFNWLDTKYLSADILELHDNEYLKNKKKIIIIKGRAHHEILYR